MKKLFLCLLAIPAALSMTACTDEEASAGVGFIGGVIVGSTVSGGYHHRHRYDYPYDYGYGYGNNYGYGFGYHGPGYGADYGPGYYGWNVKADSANSGKKVSRAQRFAKKYGTSVTAGQKVVTAFDRGAKGDLAPMRSMGLDNMELAAIYDGNMPSAGAMERLASSLNVDSNKAHRIMKSIVNTVQHQRKAHGR